MIGSLENSPGNKLKTFSTAIDITGSNGTTSVTVA